MRVFPGLHLDFGRCADADHGDANGWSGPPFLKLFSVTGAGCGIDFGLGPGDIWQHRFALIAKAGALTTQLRRVPRTLFKRNVVARLGVGHRTATDYMERVRIAGLTWPLPADMTDAALAALLFHPSGGPGRLVEAQPDWPAIHRELRRAGVTLSLLWEEYCGARPEGYGYSRIS